MHQDVAKTAQTHECVDGRGIETRVATERADCVAVGFESVATPRRKLACDVDHEYVALDMRRVVEALDDLGPVERFAEIVAGQL